MPVFLWAAVSWLLRVVVIKFLVFTVIFITVAFLVPFAVEQLTAFIGVGSLTSAFSSLPSGIWYFLDYFRIPFGLPLLISAWVARFIIRRLPVIG